MAGGNGADRSLRTYASLGVTPRPVQPESYHDSGASQGPSLVALREDRVAADTNQKCRPIWQYERNIQRNYNMLSNNIRFSDVFAWLYQYGVLSDSQKEELNRKSKYEGKERCFAGLIAILKNRGDAGFEFFMKALIETSQDAIAQTVHEDLAQKYIDIRNNDREEADINSGAHVVNAGNASQGQVRDDDVDAPISPSLNDVMDNPGSGGSGDPPNNPNTTVPKEIDDTCAETPVKEVDDSTDVKERVTRPKEIYKPDGASPKKSGH